MHVSNRALVFCVFCFHVSLTRRADIEHIQLLCGTRPLDIRVVDGHAVPCFASLAVGHLLDCTSAPAGASKIPGVVYAQSALPALLCPTAGPGGSESLARAGLPEVRPGASADPLTVQLLQLAKDVAFVEAARRQGSRLLVFDDAGGATYAAGVVMAYLMQSEGVPLLSAYLHVRERLLFVAPPVPLVQLLGAWRVHVLDNLEQQTEGAQETPRFADLAGSLATPRQLSARVTPAPLL